MLIDVPPPMAVAPRATIVIAEDDAATRMLLSAVLTRENFRVIAVENGQLACDAVRRERPDVVLLDWRMPVMDGCAALHELKSSKATRGIPIVMLTSHSQVDERIVALESGVQDFLSKPFDPRELVACIEQQLRWQHGLALDARADFLEERNALLAASERRYRLLAEAMPHMVWMARPSGQVSYVNAAWTAYTAAPLERIGKDGWAVALHPDDRSSSLSGWRHSLATGEPFEIQCRFRRASDGMYRWHLGRAIPTRDADGTIVEWVGSCADVHDYKIAGETRAILDTIGSIVTIRTEAGFVDYASPYWNEYTGASAGAGLGFDWRAYVHPDDLAAIEHERAQLDTTAHAAHQCEMRIRSRAGAYRWFLTHSRMLPHEPDEPRRWLDTSTDIDDLQRTQTALKNSETRYRALTDSMPQMVWVIDATANFEYVNHRWSEYTGLTLEQTRSAGHAAVVNAEDLAAILAVRQAPKPTEYVCEARFRRADGTYRWHVVRAVPFRDATDNTEKWIGTATDIENRKAAADQLASAAAELERLANYDTVTSLPNRKLLAERLTQAIALAQRGKSGVIILYLDLDRFKIINDTLGHAAGDRVLAVTGKRITDALRSGDTASRVGGDEFVLVCATSDGAADAARLARRLHAAIGQPIEIGDQSASVGVSIGISLYPSDDTDGERLIEKADEAMYSAKQSGRNAFRIYSAEHHSESIAALDFEKELQAALTDGQIIVHYQPILSLDGAQLIGAEALVRWDHPRRGLLAPAEFLAFAAEHRLLAPIAATVLEAVCREIARLVPLVGPTFSIAMNVSGRQFLEPTFTQLIADALARHHIDPQRLEIEISEKVVMGDPETIVRRLEQLRVLGVRVAIDNFGTGYSSLASLKDYPLSGLKIDRSFVSELADSAPDQAVAKTIITLGHSLGLRVIAEGVETPAQISALKAYGSDAFQGYLASRPMSGPDLERFSAGFRANSDTDELK